MNSRLALVLLILPLLIATTWAAEIHDAARSGDLDRLRTLIDGDHRLVYAADDRDCYPVHFAADGGHLDVLALLYERGAGLNVLDVDGDTPLHWAAIRGRTRTVAWLLDRGVAIDAQNFHLTTPLLYAVRRLKYETVETLVRRGADLELANDYGRGPLLWCVREGGDLRMARLLLDLGADVNAIDKFDDTPLSLAAWRGFRTLVDVLLEAGAEVTVEGDMGEQLLAEAAQHGLTRLYERLAAGGMEIDPDCDWRGSWLHRAARGGSVAIVADLAERGAVLDAADSYGWTPLHYAAAWGRTEALAELLRRGADPDLRTLSGCSALNLAERQGRPDAIRILGEHGADASPRALPEGGEPYFGQTPPGREPGLFAPDIVADPFGQHGNVTLSPDLREAFWSGYTDIPDSGYWYGTILHARVEDGRWTAPRMASFAGERQSDDVPCFAPDGSRLYFLSRRPTSADDEGRDENIWYVEREGDGWGEPVPLPENVNRFDHHWQFSVAADGDLYFSARDGASSTEGIWRAERDGDGWLDPVHLGFRGETPFIAPDESYLITLEFGPAGRSNLIRYRRPDGGWSEPVDITAETDRGIGGLCPQVTPDGRYFLFLSGRSGNNNSWWVEADFIEGLRPTAP